MKNIIHRGLTLLAVVLLSACGYGYYMGLHGPSIQRYPDVHSGVTEDVQCLKCHDPDNPVGPPTSHPEFTGCLKCHNDNIKNKK